MSDPMLGFGPLLIRSVVDQEVEKLLLPLKQLKKGDKGDKGKDGYTPQKGKDYFDGLPGKDGYTPLKGIDYRDGLDGKDGRDGLTPEIPLDLIRESVRFVFEGEKEALRGEPGKPGPSGIPGMRMRGEWKQGEKYSEGDLVALGGDIWYAENSGPESRPGRGTKWKLFLRSQAGRLSGYGVVQGQGGGGLTSLTIGSTPISSGGAGQVLFTDATGAILSGSANLTYAETGSVGSGPVLKVGSGSTTTLGLLIGTHSSGTVGIWSTGVTPDANNYSIQISNTTNNFLGSSANTFLAPDFNIQPGGSLKFKQGNTAGAGPSITAGTATTGVSALSLTQTWNYAAAAIYGVDWTFTNTSSHADTDLFRVRIGTTVMHAVHKTGTMTIGAVAYGSLPTAVAGMVAYVTDSSTATWGATIAGGGANKVLAWYNGSAWTVAGA